jgi:hypothetical protein
VTTLVNLYADGKHDKLFKHGTVEENTRKEAILKELHARAAPPQRRQARLPRACADAAGGTAHESTECRNDGE